MYKDKDRQREANRRAQAKFKAKGITKGITKEGITDKGITLQDIAANNKRGKDIKCFADLPPDVQATIISMSTRDGKLDKAVKARRTVAAIKYQHLFPDSYEPQGITPFVEMPGVTGKPGDADYDGVCLDAKYDGRRMPTKPQGCSGIETLEVIHGKE